jgi:hypothetical protein
MSFFTDWFLANEDEAEAVASVVTTEAHSFEEWPNIAMKNIGDMELRALWGVLRGDSSLSDSVMGKLLFQASDEGPFVCRVVPEFIAALATIPGPDLSTIAAAWARAEMMSRWAPVTLAELLGELVQFARRAQREAKPLLQMNVL